MAIHNELGKEGEDRATAHLLAEGYAIRHRNWRCGHKELDIVAEKDRTLVVVEVKTRRNSAFGAPEEALSPDKLSRIIDSTDAYLRMYAIDLPVRFDVISIVTDDNGQISLKHITDAFRPTVS